MLRDFKEFAMRGNVMDLAIAVIIGGAFGKIITSFVNDIVMPLLNPLIPQGDWRTLEVGTGVKLGSFMGTVLDFIIIAFVIFMVVRVLNKLKRKEEAKPSAVAEVPQEVKLLAEIRDLLKARE
ncbi:MAG TPA: large conductance mechanosensitive channel protein MscL [Chryseosolibacter sp.]|nr:large conductance mechanosensitive channel protein MscL [Chryseosolibacter sp.]